MAKDLIIVESPAKVKTIKKFLNAKYQILASVGHVRDLPTSTLGVDEANGFMPQYEVIENKQKVVDDLRKAAAKANIVYLAPDPDREGEAIAWHVAALLNKDKSQIKRIQFNEITAKAVREALEHPRELNNHLFDAQQARRVLDRLVGYKISPLLWKHVKRGISAGRVQSVALRLIVEREEERRAFVPEEYWPFKAFLNAEMPPTLKTDLYKIDGKKAHIGSAEEAEALENKLRGNPYIVASIEEKERSKAPLPPFITSTLQQSANQRHGYSAKRTMSIAQRLYEGVDIGDMGITALITYMRTDSTRIADEAKEAAAAFILQHHGKDFLPKGTAAKKTTQKAAKKKGNVQDAHEAIRPVDVNITPDMVKAYLPQEQHTLYRLVWSRFVASQMAAARYHDTTVTVRSGPENVPAEKAILWRTKGVRMLFPGWTAVYARSADESTADLPPLKEGQVLQLENLHKEQKFTQPPARYTEASLVRELEERGIGRPSTYASIISTLQDRDYVHLEDKHFSPTDLGSTVCDQLRQHFATLMDVGFTAQMEANLDKVAEGESDWVDLMRTFHDDFIPTLEAAAQHMQSVKAGLTTDVICPECGKPMLVKFGKAGTFLACSGYPDCRHTTNFIRDEKGTIIPVEREKIEHEVVGQCPECTSDLIIRKSRTGSRFIACTGYPKCKYAAPFSTGVPCPACDEGRLVEKSSKRGKIFYSCDTFPKCDYALWDYPLNEKCPECGWPILVRKVMRGGAVHIRCPQKTCKYSRSLEGE